MSPPSYSTLHKSFHWLIFLLVLACYGLTFVQDFYPRGDPARAFAWWVHISFGILLFVLVVLRILTRLVRGVPAFSADSPAWERLLAHTTHLILYILLVAIPALGIALTWLRGDTLTFFGLFIVPSPIATDPGSASTVREAHDLCANAILIVAGIHALAALWHHFVRKDDVMNRMLP